MITQIIQILLIVLAPYLWIRIVQSGKVGDWLSPVVLAYLTGIAVTNLNIFPIDSNISTRFSEGTILLALPLLLFSTNLKAWWKHARSTILSFTICVVAGIFCSVSLAFIFQNRIENTWMLSGMLVGVYTGGTPNMQAIGIALGASEDLYVLLNAADIVCGGIYLIFLTSIAHRVLGSILPEYRKLDTPSIKEQNKTTLSFTNIVWALGLTLLIIGSSISLCWLITGSLQNTGLLIFLLTTGSILASFSAKVRHLNGAFEAGEYLLLMFCVAIGLLADFSDLASRGPIILLYTACLLLLTLLLHVFVSKLFRIDRDTVMITSTAAVYGPVFIGQVASAIKNRELIFPGMATALVGLAIGNYCGLGVAYFLRYWLNG